MDNQTDINPEKNNKKKKTTHGSASLNVETQQSTHPNTNNAVEIIDLCTPDINMMEIKEESPILTENKSIASTIIADRISDSNPRLSIIPLYPINDEQNHMKYPLLANLAPRQLTDAELARRTSGVFKQALNVIDSNPKIPSFLREKYRFFYDDLLARLKVDFTILDYNYTRLNNYIKLWTYERIRIFNLRPHEIPVMEDNEYPLALEFFLQFDLHMFYMKTCSLRFARPRSLIEGLFCSQTPEARYELAACGNCGLCYPQYDMTHRPKKSIVEFSQAHQHTFVNGYKSILNCSATCHTRNIIYALTCPCGKVDYIGATRYSLHDRLGKHREHGNRIIHEFLLGQDNITRNLLQPKSNEMLRKDRMKLYQHSAHCPAAMQIFLDANPQYWRFVPMPIDEAQRSEQKSIPNTGLSSDPLDWNLRSIEDCFLRVEAVPKAPSKYMFSNRQIFLQTQYFHKKRDQTVPNQLVDLYNATIVAVLPETCSDMFRNLIESLFITYAQTNLNAIGNVLNIDEPPHSYPLNNPWLLRGDEWCQGLLRRPQPKPSIPTTSHQLKD